MSMKVIKQGIEVERLIGESIVQLPVRAEALVPGAGRESVSVLMADAFASSESSEPQADRVVVSGRIQCQAAYRLGQESGARALTAQAPFEQIIELPGAAPKMIVQTEADAEHVEAVYESGHMVFHVTVTLRLRLCSLDTVEAVVDIEGMDGVQKQTGEICSSKLNAETSDALSLHDEVKLPAALHARCTLMQWAEPVIERVERDLGGVRVGGEVKVEALIASGVPNRPVALVRYALPFDRLVSLPDWIGGEAQALAQIARLQADVIEGGEDEEGTLNILCDVNITVRMNAQDCMSVLTDVYSTGERALTGTGQLLRLCSGTISSRAQENFKSTLLLPEGAPGVSVVLAVRVRPIISGWREENGLALAEGILEATVLYMQAREEVLCGAQAELPFEVRLDHLPAQNAWVRAEAAEAEAAALMSDRLELRCLLKVHSSERLLTDAQILTDAEEGDAPTRYAGVGIIYPQIGDTLWSIGKKYRISEESIRAANAQVSQAEVGRPLLILKGKGNISG